MPANSGSGNKGTALTSCRIFAESLESVQVKRGLECQTRSCVAHAEDLHYKVARITRELHGSMDLSERPLFAGKWSDAPVGRFQAIVVYSLDRLTRKACSSMKFQHSGE